jgi:dynein heavy chain
MFGMHPNAEIGYLTIMCETLFDTILSVQSGSKGAGGSKDDIVLSTLAEFKTRTPAEHSLLDITAKIKDKTPAIVVCLQEV